MFTLLTHAREIFAFEKTESFKKQLFFLSSCYICVAFIGDLVKTTVPGTLSAVLCILMGLMLISE